MAADVLQYEPKRSYARASRVGDVIFLAGETGTRTHTGEKVGGDISAQTHQAMANVGATLDHYGLDWTDLVKMDVYLVDPAHIEPFLEVMAHYLPGGAPPGALVCVRSLAHHGMLVEIECVAAAR